MPPAPALACGCLTGAGGMRPCARGGPRPERDPAPTMAGRTGGLSSRLSYAPCEPGGRVNAQDVRHIGVVGCGVMGAGIVEVCARAGLRVTFAEANDELIAAGRGRIERSLEGAVTRGKLEARDRDAALGRIDAVEDVRELSATDLVIEAATEDPDAKRAIFE